MQTILVVDDDANLRELVQTYAETDGYECVQACNGLEALNKMEETPADLIVLDVMMPELDGFGTLSRLREAYDTPVILLTARAEEYDKLYGFNLGADDYLAKPFSPKELMARIKAVLKRGRSVQQDEVLRFDALTIAPRSRVVTAEGEEVALTPKEFDLLLFLAENPNIVMERETILQNVWGYDYSGDARTVDTHIKALRDRLKGCRKLIKTVWGVGYKFEC